MTGAGLQLAIARFNEHHGPHELLGLLGLAEQRPATRTKGGEWGAPCPLCGGRDRLRVWPNDPRGAGAWCRQCGFKGDALDLSLLLAGGDLDAPGARRDFLRERGYLEEDADPARVARRREEAARRKAEAEQRRAEAEAKEAADVEELAELCRRAWASAPELDAAGEAWARSRGLDPEWLGGDLIRAAHGSGLRAARLGPLRRADALLPLWNLRGELAALQGRGQGFAKGRGTRGRRGPVVFANGPAVALLRGEEAGPGPAVVCEGGADWLTRASTNPRLPVFGVVSGSAGLLGARLAEVGARLVVLRTHLDAAGHGYAGELARRLPAEVEVLRRVAVDAADAARDENDLLKAGLLSHDPTEGCEAFSLPAEPEEEGGDAGLDHSDPAAGLGPVEFPSGLAPDLAEGEADRLAREFLSAALAGELDSGAALALAPPPGDGKTRRTARAALLALAHAPPRKRGRPLLFASLRHDQLDALMLETFPAVAAELGGSAEVEWGDSGAPARLVVNLGGRELVGVRLRRFACDSRQSKDEARRRGERRKRLLELADNPRQACEGCRYLKPQRRRGSAVSPPRGGWCRYWKEQEAASEAAKPSGEADFVLLTTRRLVSKPIKASVVIQDEDLTGELAGGLTFDGDDVRDYPTRLDALEERAQDEAARAVSGRGNERAPAREDLALDRMEGLQALRAALEAVGGALGRPQGWRVELHQPEGVNASVGAAVAKWAWRKGSRLERSARKGRNLAPALGVILESWAEGRPAVLLREERDKKGRCLGLTVPIRRKLPEAPLLYLDATLVEEVAEPLLGRRLEVVRGLTPSRREAWAGLRAQHLTQDLRSKTSLTDASQGQQRAHEAAKLGMRALDRLAPELASVGVIGPKDLAGENGGGLMAAAHRRAFKDEGLKEPEVHTELYHGALSGSNRLRGCEAGHVVGMPAVLPRELRLLALHLHHGVTEEELEESPCWRRVRMGDWEGRLWCYLPASPVGLAWRARVLAPIQQAGGRFHRGDLCARALVFSCAVPFPYPLPLERGTAKELALDEEGARDLALIQGARSRPERPRLSERELSHALGISRGARLSALLRVAEQAEWSKSATAAALRAKGAQLAAEELVRRELRKAAREGRLEVAAEGLGIDARTARGWAEGKGRPRLPAPARTQDRTGPRGCPVLLSGSRKAQEQEGLMGGESGRPLYIYRDEATGGGWPDLLRGVVDELGQVATAAELGKTDRTVRRWLRADTLPSEEDRARIAEVHQELRELAEKRRELGEEFQAEPDGPLVRMIGFAAELAERAAADPEDWFAADVGPLAVDSALRLVQLRPHERRLPPGCIPTQRVLSAFVPPRRPDEGPAARAIRAARAAVVEAGGRGIVPRARLVLELEESLAQGVPRPVVLAPDRWREEGQVGDALREARRAVLRATALAASG